MGCLVHDIAVPLFVVVSWDLHLYSFWQICLFLCEACCLVLVSLFVRPSCTPSDVLVLEAAPKAVLCIGKGVNELNQKRDLCWGVNGQFVALVQFKKLRQKLSYD